MFIITSISVLMGVTLINHWMGIVLGLVISLIAIAMNSMFKVKTRRANLSLKIILRNAVILMGAIGFSLVLNLVYITLVLAGLQEGPAAVLPDVFANNWIIAIGRVLLLGISFELILSTYLQRGLAYIMGDSERSWMLSSLILSVLIALSHVEFGLLTSFTAMVISMYLLTTKMIHREQLFFNIILNTLVIIWLGIQKILFQDILFNHLYQPVN